MAEMVKLLNGVVPLGKIKRLGKLYCGAACGRGCTWAECQKAIIQANRLLKRLGKGWKPRVWENLGWHYEAVSRDDTMSVSPRMIGGYAAYFNFPGRGGGRWVGDGPTPIAAVKSALKLARDELAYIQTAIDSFTTAMSLR